MVDAGQPERRFAHHAVPAGQNILHGGGQRMAEVQLAGDVGRRHDDNEGFFIRVNFWLEIALVHPEPVPLLLHLPRLIGPGHFVWSIHYFCHSCPTTPRAFSPFASLAKCKALVS
ncbi:hypothetical protein ES703_74749 [subsurface metagenome]